ncbi:c-type cytochrome [Mucilaginibacter myungsuensis]|uniref:c-type cytochrome n=1 Tax=Mucilaginibacter myungsuensis TaxID=649104 RepID=UPI001D15EFC8|nr:cytochrome c [Mucilaginibacter myungsuensis]MDN3598941.1 cytochrome c [Mucilaginibacter myungsuensis]
MKKSIGLGYSLPYIYKCPGPENVIRFAEYHAWKGLVRAALPNLSPGRWSGCAEYGPAADQVRGPKPELISILLNGLSGEIKVNGDAYSGEMPLMAILKDGEIAAVLTYVRNNFGNKASAVTADDVKKARSANKK